MNDIASKLKGLRKHNKYSQQFVADSLGLKRSTLSNYEIGRRSPSLTELRRLAAFYGVGLEYFDIASADEVKDLLARSREIFENDNISKEIKDNLYKELALLYFEISKKD